MPTSSECAVRTESLLFAHIAYPDLAFPAGALTLVQGPSGCGKSTLLKLVNRTAAPVAGKVFVFGDDAAKIDPLALRRRVQLVGQEVFLFDGTVRSNFECFHAARGNPLPEEKTMRFFLALAQSPAQLETKLETMSGGERQRVFLAVMLSFEPQVLLLDEPSSALDAQTGRALFRSVDAWSRAKGITVIAVSHDPTLAEFLGCRTVRLEAPVLVGKEAVHV